MDGHSIASSRPSHTEQNRMDYSGFPAAAARNRIERLNVDLNARVCVRERGVGLWMRDCMCVCVCVCVRERERERELSECVNM